MTPPDFATECDHPHGDMIAPANYWLCGKCWRTLPNRPTKYSAPPHLGGAPLPKPPQIIAWQAECRRAEGGLTLGQFLARVVRRLQMRSPRLPLSVAFRIAIDAAREVGVEFGDPDFDWSPAAAWQLADEEMDNWEQTGGNS